MTEVTHVVVAEVFVDGVRVWSGTYPNVTKKQALTYAAQSKEAREATEAGIAAELKATRFVPTDETERAVV